MARRDLDVDAPAPPVGVGVLDLRIGVKHPALGVDWEAELRGGAVPLGVGGPATVSRPGGLAPARDSALELAVEPDAADGGAPLKQAPARPDGSTCRGRWSCAVSPGDSRSWAMAWNASIAA